ncbi:hypothetical protein ACYOEI_03865 [Singulisphaera rosea]
MRATGRLQGVGRLDYATACFQVRLAGEESPSLPPKNPSVASVA